MMEVQQASVQMAGHSRLEQIRASMRGESLPSGGAAAPATPAAPAATPSRAAARPVSVRQEAAVDGGHTHGILGGSAGAVLAFGAATRHRHRQRVRRRSLAEARCNLGPRARLLRKRRWALRFGVFFAFASVFWVFVTGLLAVWNTPVWALLITGLIAAGAAVPATLWLLRYRWLRGEPLPPQREASGQRLPPNGSVARPAMSALGA